MVEIGSGVAFEGFPFVVEVVAGWDGPLGDERGSVGEGRGSKGQTMPMLKKGQRQKTSRVDRREMFVLPNSHIVPSTI